MRERKSRNLPPEKRETPPAKRLVDGATQEPQRRATGNRPLLQSRFTIVQDGKRKKEKEAEEEEEGEN